MQNGKSPGNSGSTKKNYEIFRNELKGTFANSVSETKEKGHLSTFHIINSIEKK